MDLEQLTSLPTPAELRTAFPLTQARFIAEARQQTAAILTGSDTRLLLIVGPCSIHNPLSALEYARRLKELSDRVKHRFLVVMRVFLEKPRTVFGWKGYLHDPELDGSGNYRQGLFGSRELLCRLADLELPVAMEFLEPTTPYYIGDLVTWGGIGARTVTSQPHRQLAALLPMPVGFKNSIEGNTLVAAQAILAAATPQTAVGIDSEGRACVVRARGNPHGHLVLRGGQSGGNFDRLSVQAAAGQLANAHIATRILVDCGHGNCEKDFENQPRVFRHVMEERHQSPSPIAGLMLESHLSAGKQPFPTTGSLAAPDLSLTDACIGWETTEEIIEEYSGLGERASYRAS